MELIASGDSGGMVVVLVVLGVLGYFSYRAYVFFFRPELWAAERRMKHEKEMVAAEQRKLKTGRIVGGVLGGIAKAVLSAAIKGRPHH